MGGKASEPEQFQTGSDSPGALDDAQTASPTNDQQAMSSKTFALDTSVVLNDPRALFSFEDNTVVLTEYVLYELDEKKRGTEEINQNAREVGRQLEKITEGLSDQIIKSQADNQKELPLEASTGISRPIDIPGTTGKLVLLMDDRKDPVRGATRDDKILELLNRHRKDFKTPIIVVTKDTLMGIKALGLGFGRQNYRREQAKTQIRKLPVITVDKISRANDLFGKGKCREPEILQKTYQDCQGKDRVIAPGYFVLDYGNERSGLLHINREGEIRLIPRTPTICRSATTRGLNAKNLEQNAAIDALLNPEKTLVCLLGPAGTGKTLLAIGAAIHHTRNLLPQNAGKAPASEGKEERLTRRQRKQLRTQEEKLANGQETERLQIYITRPQVSMGKEMGFLPGGIDDKMDPWLQPIYDNLDQIVGQQARQKMIRDGAIKLQPLPYIRGRSLVNALLIVDESQNLTPHEVKTIITRAGRGTRIILTGDPDQIDNPYVDRLSNGLTYAADRLGREDFTAVVPLVQGERSPMSARAAELL